MKFSKWLFVILPLLVFSIAACISCSGFKPIELKSVESVKVLKSSTDGVDLELNLKIYNPNFLKFTITDADLNIVLNEVNMGKAQLQDPVAIPAHAELSQRFIVHVGVSGALLGGLASLFSIFKNKSANISLKGTIKARSLGFSKTYPVDEQTKIPFSY